MLPSPPAPAPGVYIFYKCGHWIHITVIAAAAAAATAHHPKMPMDTKNPAATETYKGGLKGYWKKRGYHRNDGPVDPRPRLNKAQLGGAPLRRRSWKIKIKPKLRLLRRISPRRFLARLRDAYVRLMLRLASSPIGTYGRYSLGDGGFGALGTVGGFQRQTLKEYDEKMIVESYKKLVAQAAFLAAAAAGGGGGGGGGGDAGSGKAVATSG